MKNTIPSVTAALRLVETLSGAHGGVSQAELANRLGLSASTCYRILQSLAEHDWVRKGPRGSWQLGHGLLSVLGGLHDVVERLEQSRIVLQGVAREQGIACKLSIRRGLEQVVVARAEPVASVQMAGREGATYPVVEGSSGAALLCEVPDAEVAALFAAAPSKQTTLAFVRAALRDLRRQGWCSRERIGAWPIAAMSAPVRDADGAVVASLSFIVPEDRRTDPALAPLLLATAATCGHAPA